MRGGLEWAARQPGDSFKLAVGVQLGDITSYEYELSCVIRDNRCELLAEQLERVRYRARRDGTFTESGRIKLYTTDPLAPDSPNITARLYNEKRGTPRQLSRSSVILHQLRGQKLRSEIEDGVSQVLAALQSIFILDPIPSHMRGFSPLSDRLESDARNIAGVLAALPHDERRAVEEELTNYGKQLPERDINRVYAEVVGKFKSDAMLYCEEQWNGSHEAPVVDARGMSDGTLRFLAIVVALLTRPKGSLLVVEEVDNGLHPSRSGLLLDVLRTVGTRRSVDIVVTTHNPALLDRMGLEMIPMTTVAHRDPEAGFSRLTLLEDIRDLPKLLAHGQVGRLTSEGLIEEAIHRQNADS
ncbi:ATP-binding protein [Sphingomonas sp. RHCKR7]|uniref:AAA family ATPase n=1 Tax=Sphingomonas folli TaxID=2862497 RepID=UPI001C6859E2|nr:ATP-binding protein [Sphingomonas folli]MBW6528192.1 ATP-binding protein [Sphingomonas folli]